MDINIPTESDKILEGMKVIEKFEKLNSKKLLSSDGSALKKELNLSKIKLRREIIEDITQKQLREDLLKVFDKKFSLEK